MSHHPAGTRAGSRSTSQRARFAVAPAESAAFCLKTGTRGNRETVNLCAEKRDHQEDQGLRTNQSWQEKAPPPLRRAGKSTSSYSQICPALAPEGPSVSLPHYMGHVRVSGTLRVQTDVQPSTQPGPQLRTEAHLPGAHATPLGTVSLCKASSGRGPRSQNHDSQTAVSSTVLGLPSYQSTQWHLCKDTGFKTHTGHKPCATSRASPPRTPLHTCTHLELSCTTSHAVRP